MEKDREEFERLILEINPHADIEHSSLDDGYMVPSIRLKWEGYKMRQPEIDALKAEVDKWKDELCACTLCLEDAHAENAALKAENERLRKDAERYRWLRDNIEKFGEELQCVDDEDSDGYYSRYILPSECDEAIDAAIKEAK